MKRSIISAKKSGRGRPRVDTEAVNVRLPRPILSTLDAFIADEAGHLTRPQAIRKLIDDALTGLGYRKPSDENREGPGVKLKKTSPIARPRERPAAKAKGR